MGGGGSAHKKHKKVPEKDFKALADTTKFSLDEIRSLYVIYTNLKDSDIPFDSARLAAVLGLKSRNLASLIFSALCSADGLAFMDLCRSLSALSARASERERADFVFKIYDVTKSGTIGKDDVRKVLTACLEENENVCMTDEQIAKVCDKTISDFDSDGDGRLTFEDFHRAAERNPGILNLVSLNLEGALLT